MTDCPRCGTPNPDGSRFCNNCGASLVTRVGVHERRVVTALFADLARSTGMGERLDPEVTRRLVGDFFELARTEIERRGGTVEKFSGDAVMAVFGLPLAHEDDPERAVRAALAIRDGLAQRKSAAHDRYGIDVEARIGIESGEVVVGDPFGGATMATGDAMNLAARLEQQADPGAVVVGEAAYDHIRDLVTAHALGELALRGHEGVLKGWRIESVADEVGRPRGVPGLQAPLTGRDEELALLLDAAERAERERKAVLFTVFGVPGVGKSRLVRETADQLTSRGWQVVRGRCLPYGDGITYWALQEMIRTLAGIDRDTAPGDATARLTELAGDPEIAARLALALGGTNDQDQTAGGGDREIAWAVRRLVEHLAETSGPLMMIFEDIHWAEPQLLDLIEYVATWTRDAPLLIVCPSRPELLDARPAWGSGRMEASRILLEPLTEDESRELLAALLAVDDLPAQLRQRVLDRAEGNPLFVEEVVRMLIEEGLVERRANHWVARREAADVRVPESVEALIRARLDTLPEQERAVLQAASVVGRVFQGSAVAAISDDRGLVDRHLEDAVLRDLITEERVPDEPTFRFRHILIRDVAYATLPKARRASLHAATADWLRSWAGSRIDEFAEIEAYHLEQAVLLRRELSTDMDPTDVDRAAAALEASARLALGRDDARAARSFATRGLALEPPSDRVLELQGLLIDALRRMVEFRAAGEVGERLEPAAHAAGRKDLEGLAKLAKASMLWVGLEQAQTDKALPELRAGVQLLREAGDLDHLTQALELLGFWGYWNGNPGDALPAWQEMRDIAHAQGWFGREATALTLLGRQSFVSLERYEGMAQLIEARRLAERSGSRYIRARVDRVLAIGLEFYGPQEAVDGDAEQMFRTALAVLEEFGDRAEANVALVHIADIRQRAGEPDEAVALLERSMALVGDHAGYRPETQRRLAQAILATGDVERAEKQALEARAGVAPDDTFTVATTEMALGQVRDAQGRTEEAETLLRNGVHIVGSGRFGAIELHLALTEFLLRHGRPDAADALRNMYAILDRLGLGSPFTPYVEAKIAAAAREGGVDLPGHS